MTHHPLADIAAGLSAERFGAYRQAAGGHDADALALYEWNATVSAALWTDLAHCEVLVRNTLHEQLTAWSTRVHREPVWYRDPGRIFTVRHASDVATARHRATTGARAKPETPGRVVAELSFGFWRYLVASQYERSLWLPVLRYKFRNLPRRHLHSRLARLHDLRNRIAHHEPIHSENLGRTHTDLLTVLGWISPQYRRWVEDASMVRAVLAARP